MKRFFVFLAAVALCVTSAMAADVMPQDSLRTYAVDAIEVVAVRADDRSAIAHTDLSPEEVERHRYGMDFPSLLAQTPSVIATNETGIGIGGTSFKMRGTDATRLNVTINGVAMNNPDSHSMYWYDTPDLISAVGDVQVQRGAGVSTNGTGAFGGAVSMTTAAASHRFGGEASLSYGSYNTQKQGVQLSSGLLGGRWAVDARLTHISSDGYIDRGATDLKSYMLQGSYYGDNTVIKLLSFGGKAKTYLTYTGVTKEEMELYGRRYHSEGQYETDSGPYQLADGTHVDYYDDHTDNYLQLNNQLIVNQRLSDRWMLNLTGFYTYGYGYYRQYKADRTLAEYLNLGITDYGVEADIIRSKIMENHTGGVNAAAAYKADNLSLIVGGSWSTYACPHWGELDWVDGMRDSAIAGRWYDNDVRKQDANLFAKVDWSVVRGLDIVADVQYRHVHYKAWGVNDNFDWNTMQMQPIDINNGYNFLNPHLGISYRFAKRHQLYGSAAIAHKEPTRSDFTDRYMFSADDKEPQAEALYDVELGYNYSSPKLSLGINLYYMIYRNQLVHTGLVNDGSDALNVNVPKSYRRGVELSAAWRPLRWLSLGGNATFSENKIRNYVDMLADSPTYGENLGDMTISYSPDAMGKIFAGVSAGGFEAMISTTFVGKQYFTNNEIEALSLEAYNFTNLDLSYTISSQKVRSVRFGVTLYNLFNQLYCSNGYGYSYMWDGQRYDEAYYFPQAPLHILANVTVRF
jgi:iron complex outermembrane receptor protein